MRYLQLLCLTQKQLILFHLLKLTLQKTSEKCSLCSIQCEPLVKSTRNEVPWKEIWFRLYERGWNWHYGTHGIEKYYTRPGMGKIRLHLHHSNRRKGFDYFTSLDDLKEYARWKFGWGTLLLEEIERRIEEDLSYIKSQQQTPMPISSGIINMYGLSLAKMEGILQSKYLSSHPRGQM